MNYSDDFAAEKREEKEKGMVLRCNPIYDYFVFAFVCSYILWKFL